jgi:hypothetical protein
LKSGQCYQSNSFLVIPFISVSYDAAVSHLDGIPIFARNSQYVTITVNYKYRLKSSDTRFFHHVWMDEMDLAFDDMYG